VCIILDLAIHQIISKMTTKTRRKNIDIFRVTSLLAVQVNTRSKSNCRSREAAFNVNGGRGEFTRHKDPLTFLIIQRQLYVVILPFYVPLSFFSGSVTLLSNISSTIPMSRASFALKNLSRSINLSISSNVCSFVKCFM
jgi:hypothetical protein